MNINSLVTRVDVEQQQSGKCLVLIWNQGWKAGNPPATVFKTDEDYQDLIDHLKAEGFEVLEWGIGARAWLGEIVPVRTGPMIRQKRKQINNHASWWRERGVDLTLNLAFYL